MPAIAAGPSESATAHLVRLFDSEQSIIEGVARFVREGFWKSEQILVLMDEARWNAVSMRLALLGCAADDAVRFGRIIVRDTHDTLKKFMVADRPHPRLFAATVGALVEGQVAFGRPVRIYGELVDALAAQGHYNAALELEELWNGLATRHRFTLLCGYTAGHFGDPRNAGDLRRICAAHRTVAVDPQDLLGSFLVKRLDAA
jgi:DcmR-like sensory protein